jgi:hypothetical protein
VGDGGFRVTQGRVDLASVNRRSTSAVSPRSAWSVVGAPSVAKPGWRFAAFWHSTRAWAWHPVAW